MNENSLPKGLLSRAQATYYGIGRVLIYLLAAAVAGDWKTIIKRLLGIKSFFKQALSAGVSHYLVYYLDRELAGCASVLDLGCGTSSWVQVCSIPYSVGVEVFRPYLQESKRKGLHTQYIQADVRNIEFKEGSFDAVIASDVIEHLTKEEGYRLIQNMERWAKKKVIISTPKGYVHQDRSIDSNPFQRHMSGWDIAELEQLGFKVYGARGWQALKDHEGEKVKFKPEIFWQTISNLTSVVLHRFPAFSVALFCVKVIK